MSINPLSSVSPAVAGGVPSSEAEQKLEGSASLARAARSSTTTYVPATQREADAMRRAGARGRAAEGRMEKALESARADLSGFSVSEAEASKALSALEGLRPDEVDRVLGHLQEEGCLDELVTNLPPERLADLTAMLFRAGLFEWAPAADKQGNPAEDGPSLIKDNTEVAGPLGALAHDINLAIAKQRGGELYEPNGSKLDAKEYLSLGWADGLFGAQRRKVESVAHRYLAATDIDASVHQLAPGDSYRLSLEAGVKVGLGAKGTEASVGPTLAAGIEVARTEDGRFTVSADSSLMAKLGASVGVTGTAKLKAELASGGGGKVEFSFETADQAARAAKLLAEAGGNPMRFVAHAAAAPGDVTALFDAVSAVELGPQAAAKLGLEAEAGHSLLGAEKSRGGEAAASGSTTYRVEFEDGRASALSVKSSASVELSASQGQAFKAGDLSLDFGKSGGVAVRAELEKRVELKPGEPLSSGAKSLLACPTAVTVVVEGKKGSAFGESGAELEFKAEGDSAALAIAVAAMTRGDASLLFHAMDKAEVTTRRSVATGASVSMGVEAGGDGASVSLKGVRKRLVSQHTVEGSGREMAFRMMAQLRAPQPGSSSPVDPASIRR